nr:hypothetical protein [Bacillus pumilus]
MTVRDRRRHPITKQTPPADEAFQNSRGQKPKPIRLCTILYIQCGIGSPHEWRHGGAGTMHKVNSFHCAELTEANRDTPTFVINANVTESLFVTFVMQRYEYVIQ